MRSCKAKGPLQGWRRPPAVAKPTKSADRSLHTAKEDLGVWNDYAHFVVSLLKTNNLAFRNERAAMRTATLVAEQTPSLR